MTSSPHDHSQQESQRFRAATFALVVTLVLTVGKFLIAHITSSVGVLSEGIHSSLDLLSAAVAFFTIREAIKPADADHPFGHGKIETLSSLLEATLLVPASFFIFYESYEHWKNPTELKEPWLAFGVMVVALLVSFAAFLHNRGAAKSTESRAIEVNALHFLADAATSGGVALGIVVIYFTGLTWIDPLIGILIGLYILYLSAPQIWAAVQELADSRLPDSEIAEIEALIKTYANRIIEIHDLRTRKSGINRYIEFHLTTCGKETVEESHQVCDEMEHSIETRFPRATVSIHVEPCGNHDIDQPIQCARSIQGECEFRKKLK
ncbi:MAG: cation transporter [Proteobacteria bacterium]|nr:MAG: cation transporter [Pseudomonadota bacterium]